MGKIPSTPGAIIFEYLLKDGGHRGRRNGVLDNGEMESSDNDASYIWEVMM